MILVPEIIENHAYFASGISMSVWSGKLLEISISIFYSLDAEEIRFMVLPMIESV